MRHRLTDGHGSGPQVTRLRAFRQRAKMNDLLGHQPPVTRCLIVASATLMILCTLDMLSPFSLYLNWQLIIYELQLWRLVTCFLFFGTFGLPFFCNTYFISGAMIDLMTYVWGRRNSAARMQVLFFTVRAPYLSWVLAWISLLMNGNIQDHLMGIAVGHVYYFFEDVYP